MTTIVDPLGTPSVVFNLGGTAIVPLTSAGSTSADATLISHIAGVTVVAATATADAQGFILDANFQIGDVVEIFFVAPDGSTNLYPQSGGKIRGNTSGASLSMSNRLRKVTSTDWSFLST